MGSSLVDDPATIDRAVEYFTKALELAPDLQRARYKLARLYVARDQKDKPYFSRPIGLCASEAARRPIGKRSQGEEARQAEVAPV